LRLSVARSLLHGVHQLVREQSAAAVGIGRVGARPEDDVAPDVYAFASTLAADCDAALPVWLRT
jgi:hypothetical protein